MNVDVAFMRAGDHICSTVPVEVPPEIRIHDDPEPPAGHGVFRILTAQDGDRRVVWNRFVLEEIRAARNMFLDLVKKGLVPHKVGTGGKPTSEVIREFDPNAEEIIFLPVAAVVGG